MGAKDNLGDAKERARPLLMVDIDGVISLFGAELHDATRRPEGSFHSIDGTSSPAWAGTRRMPCPEMKATISSLVDARLSECMESGFMSEHSVYPTRAVAGRANRTALSRRVYRLR